MGKFVDLFKKPDTVPLPLYPGLKIKDLPPASILLFYGGNKLTELVGNRIYKHPYRPPAFHAAFYIGNFLPDDIGENLFLNVGKFKEIVPFASETRSTRRIDAISFPKIEERARRKICAFACKDISKPKFGLTFPDYSFTDYLRFGLRFLKPSKKDFCSENVCEIFDTQGVKVSDRKAVDTAPWDLLEFAELHRDAATVNTLWCGGDFK